MNAEFRRKISDRVKNRPALWRFLRNCYLLASGEYFNLLKSHAIRKRQSKNLQKYGITALSDALNAARSAGMSPFLINGTLLGCCREGRFIKNDHDIDLGILEDDFTKLEVLIGEMAKAGFTVKEPGFLKYPLDRIGKRFYIQFFNPKYGFWVDFDLFYTMENDVFHLEDRIVDYVYSDQLDGLDCPKESIFGYAFFYPREVLLNLKEADFLSLRVLIPEKAQDYLKALYGDWKTPSRKPIYMNLKVITHDKTKDELRFLKAPRLEK